MAITFVTSFFDIGRQTDAPMQKFDNYFAWIEELLKLPINIYFFTSPGLHNRFNYTPRPNLKFKFLPEIPYFDRLDDIKEAWKNYVTGNTSKDTAEFGAMTHAKFRLLCQAIIDDPFGDDHYAWIDAGLLKIATNPELIPSLTPPNKVRMMMLNYISDDEVKDPNFVYSCRYKYAAGLFIAPKVLMRVFCLLMIAQAEHDLFYNRFGLEQEYMAIIYRKYPELFDPYYGTFSDLIVNYLGCNRNSYVTKDILTTALKHNDKIEAAKVAKYILQAPDVNDSDKKISEICLRM